MAFGQGENALEEVEKFLEQFYEGSQENEQQNELVEIQNEAEYLEDFPLQQEQTNQSKQKTKKQTPMKEYKQSPQNRSQDYEEASPEQQLYSIQQEIDYQEQQQSQSKEKELNSNLHQLRTELQLLTEGPGEQSYEEKQVLRNQIDNLSKENLQMKELLLNKSQDVSQVIAQIEYLELQIQEKEQILVDQQSYFEQCQIENQSLKEQNKDLEDQNSNITKVNEYFKNLNQKLQEENQEEKLAKEQLQQKAIELEGLVETEQIEKKMAQNEVQNEKIQRMRLESLHKESKEKIKQLESELRNLSMKQKEEKGKLEQQVKEIERYRANENERQRMIQRYQQEDQSFNVQKLTKTLQENEILKRRVAELEKQNTTLLQSYQRESSYRPQQFSSMAKKSYSPNTRITYQHEYTKPSSKKEFSEDEDLDKPQKESYEPFQAERQKYEFKQRALPQKKDIQQESRFARKPLTIQKEPQIKIKENSYSDSLINIKEKLTQLQKNKYMLEQKMIDFEKKINSNIRQSNE